MSSYSDDFTSMVANFINSLVHPFAKYVIENRENLSDITEDELAHAFREIYNISKPTNTMVNTMPMGMTSMAPIINNMGIPGMSNIAIKDTTKKTRTVKKDAPEQVWMTIDSFSKAIAEGAKICSFCSSRSKDHKDMVCGARVDDAEGDYTNWRCVSCKGKTGEIVKKLKSSTTGISPGKVAPGLNIPSNTPKIMPNPMLPPPLPTLPNLPTITNLPTLPNLSNLGLPKMPVLPVKPPTPVKVEEIAPTPETEPELALDNHPGLNGNYIAKNEDLRNFIFAVDQVAGVVNVIGKFDNDIPTPAPSNYMELLVELTPEEQASLVKYKVLKYKFTPTKLGFKIPGLPTIPGLPSLPTM
jgi:hypothetical protein